MIAPIRFLNSPQPTNQSYTLALKTSVYVSLFVGVFLAVFQPFGLSNLESSYKILVIASFGLPCLLPDIIISCGLVYLFRHTKMANYWKVWHTLAVMLLYLLVIGASNSIYACFLYGADFSLSGFIEMETSTALVGFFPSAAVFISARAVKIYRNQNDAAVLNNSIGNASAKEEQIAPEEPKASKVTLVGVNRDESVSADANDICFLKSDGNYVEVVVAEKNSEHETKLLRATLKDMETQLAEQYGNIVRCHRSYLVNKKRIASAEGNAMGLTITLDRDGLQVPVSRSFVATFKA